jgi:hypothetical protein
MIAIINKNTGIKEFKKILISFAKNRAVKGIDTSKYCDTIKLSIDPLVIQEEMRNEWK